MTQDTPTNDNAARSDSVWHSLSIESTIAELDSHLDGLGAAEVERRLKRHGANRLEARMTRGPVVRFLAQFHNVLLYVMMIAAAITAFLQEWIDTGVLLAAVLVNVIIGFLQEGKAESALDAIRNMLAPRATVRRHGHTAQVDAAGLVPGDIVLLEAGDRVPADMRLLDARFLQIDEAALTGESVPSEKETGSVTENAPLGDRRCMAYSGTVVTRGQGTGVVIATGKHTQLGEINQMLAGIRGMTTPLLRQMNRFSYWLAAVIIGIGVLVYFYGTLIMVMPAVDTFMMVVALVASAIPEGLPALLTVTLALGVQRMAKRQAIVRRLPAVETLGSVTVICTDKTGTLTYNEMTVQRVVCADRNFDVAGAGYVPDGTLSLNGTAVKPADCPDLSDAILTGVLCNDARLLQVDGNWVVEGDPTEGALLVLGEKAGMEHGARTLAAPRLDAIPFDSANRYMATLHTTVPGEEHRIMLKGAPERVIEACAHQRTASGDDVPLDPDYWRRMAVDIAARGLRVLALAQYRTTARLHRLEEEHIGGNFTLLALVGIMDLPRTEAIDAVSDCHKAGIQVKMITGDHVDTARAVGAQLDIGIGCPAVTGAEIALMDDDSLKRNVLAVDVFARASPEHKLRLVQALQRQGHIVAMTGDGVNDSPALKRADVGVAMGKKGTEAAKEAADIILADDNFATIAAAVSEGRAVYDNIRKFILFMLPTNGGELLIVIAALVFGLALPLSPAQILWINMVTASALGMALAFEPPESDIMLRKPRPAGEGLLSGFFLWRIAFVSVLMMSGALALFLYELERGAGMDTARTLVVNAIVVSEMVYLLCSRHIYGSVLNREGILGNPWVVVSIAACGILQLAYTYTPFMQTVFQSAPLTGTDWLKVLTVGAYVLLASELEKWLRARWRGA